MAANRTAVQFKKNGAAVTMEFVIAMRSGTVSGPLLRVGWQQAEANPTRPHGDNEPGVHNLLRQQHVYARGGFKYGSASERHFDVK